MLLQQFIIKQCRALFYVYSINTLNLFKHAPQRLFEIMFPMQYINCYRKYSADNLEVPLDIDFGEHFL